jgi:glycosyltransferase involved in cell wall biosynthesis
MGLRGGEPISSDIDISLVLTLHREGRFLLRTLHSLVEAADYAQASGISTEFIFVLDRCDALTKSILLDFVLSKSFSNSQILEVNNGSLGLSRNDGVSVAHGKWVALCDGDDLVSYNFYANMFFAAETKGPLCVQLPRWLMAFGASCHFGEYYPLEYVTPLALIDAHPFISRTFAHVDLYKSLPFKNVSLSSGYAYEDWHHNAEAVANGYDFDVVNDTILFYRQRKSSLLKQANQISTRQIPPSSLFNPVVFRSVCRKSFEQIKMGEDPRVKNKRSISRSYFSNPVCKHLISAANKIDPAINISQLESSPEYTVLYAANLDIGCAYYDLTESLVDTKFTDVFLLPYLGVGGGERYLLNVIEALSVKNCARILVILGEHHPTNEWLSRVPANVNVLNLAPSLAKIGEIGVDLVTLKLIQNCASDANLHIRDSVFGHRFLVKFGAALEVNTIFYGFTESVELLDGTISTGGWLFNFISENWDKIDRLIFDNVKIIDDFVGRLGLGKEKFFYVPIYCNPNCSVDEVTFRANAKSNNVLWASRIDWQKRPSLIPLIAEKMSYLLPELIFNVYGDGPEEVLDKIKMSKLKNIKFKGTFGTFEEVQRENYLCLVYTSIYDGIPIIVLEASGSGIPVIAADVGGISEHITNLETGLLLHSLLDDDAMANSYVEAIARLAASPDQRESLAVNAFSALIKNHSRVAFEKNLFLALENS